MKKARVNTFVILTSSLLLGIVGSVQTGHAYNRVAAADYAYLYSEPDLYYNSDIYYRWDPDCANFVSQCLIAGGIRFRSSIREDDNVWAENYGEMYPPGVNTKWIQNNSEARKTWKYSRTITGADYLRGSLEGEAHGGNEYKDPHPDDDPVWSTVETGDACFQMTGETAHHSMFIYGVNDSPPRDLRYCAHNAWDRNRLLKEPLPDWQTSKEIHIVCLPDAPIVKVSETEVWSGENHIRHKWGRGDNNSWKGNTSWPSKAGNGDLTVQLTFDCPMKTSEPPVVKLEIPRFLLPIYIQFTGIEGPGWFNGWRTGASTPTEKYLQTWKGYIPASEIPYTHTTARVLVRAQGADSSFNDGDNELSCYNPSAPMDLLKIDIDKQKVKGKGRP